MIDVMIGILIWSLLGLIYWIIKKWLFSGWKIYDKD
jgi:hypothetical protein